MIDFAVAISLKSVMTLSIPTIKQTPPPTYPYLPPAFRSPDSDIVMTFRETSSI